MKNKSWNTILSKLSLDFEMKKGITSFVNPYSMLLLKKDVVTDQVDYWYIDGSLLVNTFNVLFRKNYKRFSFDNTSLAPIVFKFAKENHLKVAVIGTKEEYINVAVTNIEKTHGLNITYYRNGYFNSETERLECFRQIIEKIDIVVCGMGTPYQEEFLIELTDYGWNGYGFTCGGFLHQTAQKPDYYPPLFDKLNIRWIYRIIDEPRLIKRYLVLYPVFLVRFFYYLIKQKIGICKNSFE
jgi:N-acetylglucosaminyldiphosphoundecaprenol N-acetyl-beta-D-mannosaminyltransferase